MKNEPPIWSVFSLLAVGALNISDTSQTRVMSFLVLASKIITAKSRNCQFCQFAIIQSVSGAFWAQYLGQWEGSILSIDQSEARGLTPSEVAELAPFVRNIFCIWDSNIIMRCSERLVAGGGCCDLDHRRCWPLILSFVVTHFISLMIFSRLITY